jgi:hypothetical protein
MQESILNIQLLKTLVVGHNKRQRKTNSSRLDNQAKSVFLICTISLLETFHNQLSFVPIHGSIWLLLHLVYPSTINNIASFTMRYKVPCLITQKSLILLIHRPFPLFMLQSFIQTSGFTCACQTCISNSTISVCFWLMNVVLESCTWARCNIKVCLSSLDPRSDVRRRSSNNHR